MSMENSTPQVVAPTSGSAGINTHSTQQHKGGGYTVTKGIVKPRAKSTLQVYVDSVRELEDEHPGIGLVAHHVFKSMRKYGDEALADAIGDAVLVFLKKEKLVDENRSPKEAKSWLTCWVIASVQTSRRKRAIVPPPMSRTSKPRAGGTVEYIPELHGTHTTGEEVYDDTGDIVRNTIKDHLSPEEREVIEMRFGIGINNNRPHTHQEIGERVGFTKQRAEQVDKVIKKKMKFWLGKRQGFVEDYL
tara:strand:- start:19333 stop:20070 length:738 start_codon:yes stop_codon:yes gene_type:complete